MEKERQCSSCMRDPGGKEKKIIFPLGKKSIQSLVSSSTVIKLPSTDRSNYVYKFLDNNKKTILLILENMYTYRESFEMGESLGGTSRRTLQETYMKNITKELLR